MSTELAIGVDIGGTKIAFALVDAAGHVVQEQRVLTNPDDGVSAVLDRIAEGIRQLILEAGSRVIGIGIGCPGIVDPAGGVVRNAVNLRWENVSLRDGIQRRLRSKVPVYVHRDGNALTLGEWMFGAAKNTQDYVLLAIGTGLGMGAISGGRLLLGSRALALEMGHISLNPQGRLCACGLKGCPEMAASGMGLMAAAREYLPAYPTSSLQQVAHPTTGDIIIAAQQHDPMALRIIDEATDTLAYVMTLCSVALAPELYVIGGGLGTALYDLMQPNLIPRVQQRTLATLHDTLKIVPAQISSSAIGAAALVWYHTP
ncbi:MAG: ROK family protein [Anaerolineae bacterium]|nr:ROK family protein [Anaerolineae bacterium]